MTRSRNPAGRRGIARKALPANAPFKSRLMSKQKILLKQKLFEKLTVGINTRQSAEPIFGPIMIQKLILYYYLLL